MKNLQSQNGAMNALYKPVFSEDFLDENWKNMGCCEKRICMFCYFRNGLKTCCDIVQKDFEILRWKKVWHKRNWVTISAWYMAYAKEKLD